jgi:uncharacterized membrane protein YedE/YeeE
MSFTPVSSTIGGVLIGLSATALLILNGRIAGISGILAGVVYPSMRSEIAWKVFFVAGLVVGGAVVSFFHPQAVTACSSMALAIPAGLLVGFGTRLGNGCTSGHGVCGISRFSVRSIVATMVFIATGALTVYAMRHLFGGAA